MRWFKCKIIITTNSSVFAKGDKDDTKSEKRVERQSNTNELVSFVSHGLNIQQVKGERNFKVSQWNFISPLMLMLV